MIAPETNAPAPERFYTSIQFRFLHQHPDRMFQKPSQRLHELGGFGSVADTVVNGDGGFHAAADSGPFLSLQDGFDVLQFIV